MALNNSLNIQVPFRLGSVFSGHGYKTSDAESNVSLLRQARQRVLEGSLSTTVIVGCMTIAVVFYLRSVIEASRSPLARIPGPWYASWTTLHLRYLFARGTIWKYVERCHGTYGDIIRLGPRQIWVADKDGLKDILLKTDLPKVTMYAEISRDRNGPGLFGEIRPDPHKILKKFLGPAFTVSSVDKLDTFFKACTGTLLKSYYGCINDSGNGTTGFETDFMRDLHCLALDIMGESSFGRGFGQIDKVFDPAKVKTKQDIEWAKIPGAIFDGLANRYRFVFVKRFLRRLGWDLQFDWPKDMVTHMLDQGERPDTGTKMNNREIIDQMSELLLAGSETTSGTIGCLFLEIARNEDVKRKLLASLPLLGPDSPVIDSKTVREDDRFRYLEACIKENLRMHPIASEMGRRTIESAHQIGDFYIPPYTVVSASYRRTHNDEKHWPQADRFWPERWLDGDEMEGAPSPDENAYYPFSAGKHSCIGRNFAYAEIRTVSANILTRFDVQEAGFQKIDFRQYITMQFHDGKWRARLIPRRGDIDVVVGTKDN